MKFDHSEASRFDTLSYERQQQIALIKLNRPHRLNAVTEQLYQELLQALELARQDPDIRTLVLTGEGRAFCVGADLKEHGSGKRSREQKQAYLQLANDVCEKIFSHDKLVIAAVNGYALGAGAEMALSCDFICMAEEAQIGFPEISIGTMVGGGISQILPRLLGLVKARELIFMGERINGKQANELGLIARVWPESELMDNALEFANRLSSKAPVSVKIAKQLLNQSQIHSFDAQLEQELHGILTCMDTEDWQEGVDAFAEKRPPVFKGK